MGRDEVAPGMERDPDRDRSDGVMRVRLDASLRCVSSGAVFDRSLESLATMLLGKPLADLLAHDEAPCVLETLRSVLDDSVAAAIVASLGSGEGRRRLVWHARPLEPCSEGGAALEIELRAPDARHGAARSQTSGDAGFRALAENMRDALCELDENGILVYANRSHIGLFGDGSSELLGSDPLEAVHPDDRRRVRQLFRPDARSRRPGPLVYRARNTRGRSLDLEATASEFEGEDGRTRIVVVTRDVTERENARRDLERHIQLETRVAELSRYFIDIEIDAIGQGIENRLAAVAKVADAQHSFMYAFGTGRDGGVEFFRWWLDEHHVEKVVPARSSVERFPYSSGLIMSGRVFHVTSVDALPEAADLERQDLVARGVRSLIGIPIMSGGRFVGCLGFENFEREVDWPGETIMLLRMVGEIFYSALRRRRAVEDLRDSQNQLLQSQKMEAVGTLAGGIAHDFNNHLAVMLGNARFVRQEVKADPEVVAAIEDFERSADHCAQLTRSLLTFSRRSAVEIRAVPVAELVQGVEVLIRPLLPGTIRLDIDLLPELGSVAVDRIQIQQVLVNLLVNARDSMPEGGPITLHGCRRLVSSAETTSEELEEGRVYVVLSVEDRGCGMSEEIRSRVFEPFFTTKELGHGTGLGLATAYGIIRQSKGAISVESSVGVGSIFRIYLPSVADERG
jgi:PAS domain S-box-containing protein